MHKTIDSLGDDGQNPDTTLKGEDYYRLSLDINGPVVPGTDKPAKEKENIDVVFCLDFSASMDSVMSSTESKSPKRYEAMANIMASDTVSSILSDPKNNVSVVGFWGNSATFPWRPDIPGYLMLNKKTSLYVTQNPSIDPLFSDGGTLLGWTNNASDLSGLATDITDKFHFLNSERYIESNGVTYLRYMQGTNYTAGMREVLAKLEEKKDDGNKKVLVFLSDGVPTYYLPDMSVTPVENTKIPGYKALPGSPLVDGRWGDGTESDWQSVDNSGSMKTYQYPHNMATSMQGTLNVWNGSYASELGTAKSALEASKYANNGQLGAIYKSGSGQFQQKLRAMGVNLTTYTIGVSDEFTSSGDSDAGYGQGNPYVLKQMAGTTSDCNTAGKFYNAKNSSDLTAALQEIMRDSGATSGGTSEGVKAVDNVVITDNLSAYVQLYQKQPDFKVVMQELDENGAVKAGGETKVLWEGKTATSDGKGVIQSVTYTSSSAADSTGTVKVTFDPAYKLDKKYRYTLSYNVQATNKAYEGFAQSGYGTTAGDAGTDYAASGNKTSAGKPGFFSNKDATATYKADGADQSVTYPKPVIQVGTTKLQVTKVWQDEDGNALAADQHPNSVTVTLVKDGTATNSTLTLSADNNWTGTFENLVPKKLQSDGTYASIVYTLEEAGADGFDTTVSYTNTADKAGSSFYVGDGKIVVSNSEVTHEYGNGDASATVTNVLRPRYQLLITKKAVTDADDPSQEAGQGLPGAHFTIERLGTDGASEGYLDATGNLVAGAHEFVTGNDGTVTISGLARGTYRITETVAPAGYQLPAKSMQLVVSSDGTAQFTNLVGNTQRITAGGSSKDTFSVTIEDSKIPDLPSTGEWGALALSVIGVAALAGAVVILGIRRLRT